MRTITEKIYTLSELSDKARERAYRKWLDNYDYPFAYDNRSVLRDFSDIFNLRVDHWEYDTSTYNYRFSTDNSGEVDELKGERLYKYIMNNFWSKLYLPKIFYKSYEKRRKSKVFFDNECVLTGYYLDDIILKPIYDFLEKPTDKTYYDLMDDCLDGFFKACRDDYETCCSEENFADESEANEWEYRQNGDKY